MTSAANETGAKSVGAADSALRRLANLQLPEGGNMDLRAILALHPRHSPHPALDRAIEDCFLSEFVERDPQAALAAALRGAPGHAISELASRVLQVWMKLDFEAAVTAMKDLPQGTVGGGIAPAIGRANPAKAIALLKKGILPAVVNGRYERNNLLAGAVVKLALTDPATALTAASGLFTKFGRFDEHQRVFGPALDTWLQRDRRAALNWVAEHSSEAGGKLGLLGAAAVFRIDPKEGGRLVREAMQRQEESTPPDYYECQQIVRSMVGENSDSALQYARELPADDPVRQMLLEVAAAKTGSSMEPVARLDLLSEVLAGQKTNKGNDLYWEVKSQIRGTMEQLAAADARAAMEKAQSFPDAPLATEAVLKWAMQNDPNAAGELVRWAFAVPELKAGLEKLLQSGDYQSSAGLPVDYGPVLEAVPEARILINGDTLAQWSVANPAAASKFMSAELGAGRIPKGSEKLVVQWALNDPSSAAAWVETLPQSDWRKNAETNLINTWQRADSESAKAWRAKIAVPR